MRLLSGNRGKIFQKVSQWVPAIEIVKMGGAFAPQLLVES
jgi:hypothetical protein